MSGDRPTLAEVISEHQGMSYHPYSIGWRCGGCGDIFAKDMPSERAAREHAKHVAAAAERWFLDRLADEALVERCAEALWEHDTDRMVCLNDHPGRCCPAGHHGMDATQDRRHNARAVLAQAAEAVKGDA